MTRAESALALVIGAGVLLAVFLPADTVELGAIVQLAVIGALAIPAGLYVWAVNRGLRREDAEYLWLLVRRDLRVTIGFALLALLASIVIAERIVPGFPDLIVRPWAIVWLVIGIDLFAVGLIDDALIMRRDRRQS